MTNKPYNIGDKSKAICPFCEAIKSTTFMMRDVMIDGRARNVLVSVCDECDSVVGIPQQSICEY